MRDRRRLRCLVPGTEITLRNGLGSGPTADVMRFRVTGRGRDDSRIPQQLSQIEPRRSGARPEWLPTVVLVSGTTAVAAMLVGAPQASAFRGGDALDTQVAEFAFDLGNITFANMWVALGSLSLASGWAILAGRREPGSPGRPGWLAWLGWWALAAGAGLLVARMAWPTYVWVIPYVPFWVWVLVVSTRMLRIRP